MREDKGCCGNTQWKEIVSQSLPSGYIREKQRDFFLAKTAARAKARQGDAWHLWSVRPDRRPEKSWGHQDEEVVKGLGSHARSSDFILRV